MEKKPRYKLFKMLNLYFRGFACLFWTVSVDFFIWKKMTLILSTCDLIIFSLSRYSHNLYNFHIWDHLTCLYIWMTSWAMLFLWGQVYRYCSIPLALVISRVFWQMGFLKKTWRIKGASFLSQVLPSHHTQYVVFYVFPISFSNQLSFVFNRNQTIEFP